MGATIHEMLTGHPRHTSHHLAQILEEIAESKPVAYDGLSSELEHIINKTCAKKPEQRFQSMTALRNALSAYLSHAEARTIHKIAVEEINISRH